MLNLTQIVKEHAQWLKDHKKGKQANFKGADLYRADLHGADLREAIFDSAAMGFINLEGAILTGSSLNMAHLDGANLKGAIVNKASLLGTSLKMAQIGKADFSDSNLNGADFHGADARGGVKFDRAEMLRASIAGMITDGVPVAEGAQIPPDVETSRRHNNRAEEEVDVSIKEGDSKVDIHLPIEVKESLMKR